MNFKVYHSELYEKRNIVKINFDTNGRNWETQWKNATVPYEFDPQLSEQLKQDFLCAISEYHAKTCIRFVPRNGHTRYITVSYDKNVCGSASGLKIEVGDACPGRKCSVLIHELGHHLGYAHEQDRGDRDEYIQGEGLAQKRPEFETYCLMYDYLSSQHYGSQCQVHGGQWKVLKPGVTNCGGGLSVLDVNKYNTCYNCKGCLGYRWMGINCFDSEKHKKVYGGYDVDESKLYVCRGFHNGDIIPGKASIHK
ncbi:low choriolytic enzyme-like protein, partial [Leptotrombidium deliense]